MEEPAYILLGIFGSVIVGLFGLVGVMWKGRNNRTPVVAGGSNNTSLYRALDRLDHSVGEMKDLLRDALHQHDVAHVKWDERQKEIIGLIRGPVMGDSVIASRRRR